MKGKPTVTTSFVQNEEVPSTPTISNREDPPLKSPPLMMLPVALPETQQRTTPIEGTQQTTKPVPVIQSQIQTQTQETSSHRGKHQRKPRFSSSSSDPLVVRRAFSPSSRTPSASSESHYFINSHNETQQLEIFGSLTTRIGPTISCVNMNSEAFGDDWTLVLSLLVCDLVKAGAPMQSVVAWVRKLQVRQQLSSATTISNYEPTLSIPSRRNKKELMHTSLAVQNITGLPNYGQTCFLNAVLQSLASLEPFLAYLDRLVQIAQTPPNASKSGFSYDLFRILRAVNGDNTSYQRGCVDTRGLLQKVGEKHAQFRNTYMEQQDAQEILQALLEVIISDANLDRTLESPWLNNDSDDMDDDALTAVRAGTQGQEPMQAQHDVDWSPHASATRDGYGSTESVVSLSSLLKRVDEHFKDKCIQPSPPLPTSDYNLDSPVLVNERKGKGDDIAHQREEKKQEDFEISLPAPPSQEPILLLDGSLPDTTEVDQYKHHSDDSSLSDQSDKDSVSRRNYESLSTSMHIMKSTISPITPSPLSGWLGSTLRCCRCKHVRPIQNAPFLDLPVVPTSVPQYLAGHTQDPPSASPFPACTLAQCLEEFTSIETVQDVECKSCTIQRELKDIDEEYCMLQGAVDTLRRRRIQQNITNNDGELKFLLRDLEKVETRRNALQSMDPDKDDMTLLGQSDDSSWMMDSGIDGQAIKLERGEAKKCLVLTRRPSILCLHIQRRYFDPRLNRMCKCVQSVQFPEMLDLSPYCAYSPRSSTRWAAGMSNTQDNFPENAEGKMMYRLRSVIEHRGTAFSGHYISYRQSESGVWCRISDTRVSTVSWQEVRKCQAYMLFYEAL